MVYVRNHCQCELENEDASNDFTCIIFLLKYLTAVTNINTVEVYNRLSSEVYMETMQSCGCQSCGLAALIGYMLRKF